MSEYKTRQITSAVKKIKGWYECQQRNDDMETRNEVGLLASVGLATCWYGSAYLVRIPDICALPRSRHIDLDGRVEECGPSRDRKFVINHQNELNLFVQDKYVLSLPVLYNMYVYAVNHRPSNANRSTPVSPVIQCMRKINAT